MLKTISMLTGVYFILINFIGAQPFFDVNAGLPGLVNEPSFAWGDFDNDGDLDLLFAGRQDSTGL